MAGAGPRLLVTIGRSEELDAALGRSLPDVPWQATHPAESGPWPAVEALLVGSLRHELPNWRGTSTPALALVQTLYTGVDEFPFSELPPSVMVCANVGAYAPMVAEHAVSLILGSTHHLVSNGQRVRERRLRPPIANRYLPGRTLLILGLGEIGRELASRASALGLRVEAVTRSGSFVPPASRGYPAERLGQAVSEADIIVDCRPLTTVTRDTVDADLLGRCKPDALFVNVGRAGTVVERAMFEHLRSHPQFGFATDVFWDEDFDAGVVRTRFPFADLPNFLGTPHVAGVGGGARARAIGRAVENVSRYFRGDRPLHAVDRDEYRQPGPLDRRPPAPRGHP